MSQRQTRFGWGLVLGLCGCIGIGMSIGHAQQARTPAVETLLPANSVLYLRFDGNDAHKAAWEQTAAYDALYKTGLMDVVQKVFTFVGQQAGGDKGQNLDTFKQVYEQIIGKGLSLAVSVSAGQGPPAAQATLVLHESAKLEPGLSEFIKKAAKGEIEFASHHVGGHKVTSGLIPNTPGIEVGWWTQGQHLVIVAGMQAVETAIAVADGKAANISTNPLWKKYRPRQQAGFEVSCVSWFDVGTLRKMFGRTPVPVPGANLDAPLTVSRILEALGLNTLGALACRSGYKGRAMWSETTLEAPSPRKGLMAFANQKSISMADLPPLPSGTNGFCACSVDWPKFYDGAVKTANDVAALGPPDAAVQVEGLISQLPVLLGFDLKKDLLDALGNVVCVYGDPSQGMFGMGFGVVFKVDDARKLRETLNEILGMAAERTTPRQLVIHRNKKQGREIVTLEIAGGMFNPSFAIIDEDWLAIGLFPQTVDAFLLRLDKKLAKWTPSPPYRDALSAVPRRFTSIAVSDPRETYRTLLGWAPMLMSFMQMGMKRAGLGADVPWPVTVVDLPPAEQVARPLFPNVSVCTVDDKGIHWTSRTSLPSIPLIGGAQGAATVPILVALLLPAVQQARSAARRTQSMNNMKQIGLALHNYHDRHRAFPQGTHPNEKLKVEKRLSWQAEILPYLEQAALHKQIDFDKAWDDKANTKWMKVRVGVFQNPGMTEQQKGKYGTTHYVGIAGVGKDAPTLKVTDKRAGVFGYNRVTRIRDIRDGTSNTMMVTEASKNFGPWGAGGTATIRALTKKPYINGPDGIGGPYQGGCNVLMADGSVRFVSEKIDPSVLEALSTIHGAEIVGEY